MRFKGSNKQIGNIFKILIQLYGVDAKISDIQKSMQLKS
jgi:hypothetical protein